jgi:uncharacterized protein (DUF1778 family)
MKSAKKVDNTKKIVRQNIKKNKSAKSGIAQQVKTSRLGFRASESQARIIRMASDISHKSLTDFIMNSAYEAAEKVILDQRLFMVSEEVYNTFLEMLARPEQENKKLQDLLTSSSPWDLDDIKKT